MYIKRTIEPFILNASKQFPVLLVHGPRQVGKTTLLKHLSQTKRSYVTLDDPILMQLAKNEPQLFLQRFPPPVLIDEIQYAPELLPYIKILVDREQQMGAFWLTGSQPFHLMKGVSESLAGRIAIVNLLGLSLKEQLGKSHFSEPFFPVNHYLQRQMSSYSFLSLKEIYNIIWRGSFPAVSIGKKDIDLFYSSYVQTYLQRDVRDLAHVGDTQIFLTFLRAAAARTGQLLNMSDMARDAGISPMTARQWISILQSSGIIYLLEPYHNNLSKRFVKTPKLYFLDTGLCSYLTEWTTPETLESGAMAGPILETFILTELLKTYWHNGKRAPFYFYRDKDQKEIDLLIIQDDIVYPIEFKKTANPRLEMMPSLSVLKKLNKKIGIAGLICLAPEWIPLSPTINVVPVGFL